MVQRVKYDIVAQLKERLEGAKAIVLVDYKGINVEQVNQLRAQYREAKVDYVVQKNTLIKIALNDLGITELDAYLKGPTALAICKDEEVAPAKVLVKFIKDVMEEAAYPSFKVGIVDGQIFTQAQLQSLAKLPSREEMLAKIMGSLNAPITNFLNVSQGVARKLVYALDAVAKTKAS